jgi:hypothetical protein
MLNAKNYLLTTIDNPYNPFKDWDSWFAYDLQKGYRTCQVLDRFYKTSDNISDSLDEFMYSEALDTILELFPHYCVVSAEMDIKPVSLDVLESVSGIANDDTPVEDGEDTPEGV